MARKPLEPLIPLEQFKKLVAAISHVPKSAVGPVDEARPKPQVQDRQKAD